MSDPRAALQSALGDAYVIVRELGGGSMSRVFLAEEVALRRQVAVKILPADMLHIVSIERFRREIRLAASLQHPHIVPVLSAGEAEGTPYYIMPYVSGTSLRQRLADGPLPIGDTVSVLRELARALAYAHARGVVHRDIKPENILISDGTVVITDFGIAKAITAASTASPSDPSLTAFGMTVGTPAYMAPEQAAGDPNIDHRADIYGFGCVAYELLAGRTPFVAETAQQLLVAQLTEPPVPVQDLRADVPPSLAALVMRCLKKHMAHRPQTAGELTEALDLVAFGAVVLNEPKASNTGDLPATPAPAQSTLEMLGLAPSRPQPVHAAATPGAVPAAIRDAVPQSPPASTGATRTITTDMPAVPRPRPRSARTRIVVGALLAALAVVAVVKWRGARRLADTLFATGAMTANERLLVAEFRSPATDSSLGAAISEAVRADLAQSNAVRVVQPVQFAAALRRIGAPPGAAMDFALARQVAQRDGIKAIVDGAVVQVGNGYLVNMMLYATASGDPLATFSARAANADGLLDAVETVVHDMRARIGESLRHVEASAPLEQVTTPSITALRKYTEATRILSRQGNLERGISLLEEAVALDTAFSMAYRRLAVELNNAGMFRARAIEAITKAYQHRDRLTEAERQVTIAAYYVGGPEPDLQKAVDANLALLDIAPGMNAGYNNTAYMLRELRQFARAETLAARGLKGDSTGGQLYQNLFGAQLAQGKLAEATTTLATLGRVLPRAALLPTDRAELWWNRREFDSVTTVLSAARIQRATDNNVVSFASHMLAAAYATQGQLRGAMRTYGEKRRADLALGDTLAGLADAAAMAGLEGVVYERPARGVAMLDSALAAHPLGRVPVAERPYAALVFTYGMLGRADRARALLAQFEESRRDYKTLADMRDRPRMQGAVALAEKRYADAVRLLTAGDIGMCTSCMLPHIAHAYDLAGQPDSAVAAFTRYLRASDTERWQIDPVMLAGAHKRLGELLEARGDRAGAASNYAAFLALWKRADPELQPKVAVVRANIARLQATERQ